MYIFIKVARFCGFCVGELIILGDFIGDIEYLAVPVSKNHLFMPSTPVSVTSWGLLGIQKWLCCAGDFGIPSLQFGLSLPNLDLI
jgi:hypothetical protein